MGATISHLKMFCKKNSKSIVLANIWHTMVFWVKKSYTREFKSNSLEPIQNQTKPDQDQKDSQNHGVGNFLA